MSCLRHNRRDVHSFPNTSAYKKNISNFHAHSWFLSTVLQCSFGVLLTMKGSRNEIRTCTMHGLVLPALPSPSCAGFPLLPSALATLACKSLKYPKVFLPLGSWAAWVQVLPFYLLTLFKLHLPHL